MNGDRATNLLSEDTEKALLSWQSTLESAKNRSFTDGQAYLIHYQVTNSVGLTGYTKTQPFIYDASGAHNLGLTGLPAGSVMSGEELRLIAWAEEPDSAIIEFALSIGTTGDPVFFSRLLNGNEAGKLIIRASERSEFVFSVPEIANGDYTILYEVRNASGIVATLPEAGTIRVDNSLEKLVVTTGGAYSSLPDTLAAGWKYSGPNTVDRYEYRIVKADGTTLLNWQETNETYVIQDGLTLANGEQYFFEVQAYFTGSGSISGTSLFVTVDFTPPVFDVATGLTTPRFTTSSGLWLSYSVGDNESGVEHIQVLLEKKSVGDERIDISRGWMTMPMVNNQVVTLLTDCMGNSLKITTGDTVYCTVRAGNKAGLFADRFSPAIIIDDTPPPIPRVTDQGEALHTSQYPEASWLWSDDDPESGPVTYEWTVIQPESGIETAEWYVDDGNHQGNVESTIGEDFPRIHLSVWYFVVRATNGAGLTATGMSNGFIYDETAPLMAKTTLLRGTEEIMFTQSFTDLKVKIDAAEEASSITHYSVIAGKWNENNEWIPLPGDMFYVSNSPEIPVDSPPPSASSGDVIIFRGICFNEADLASQYGYTKGVKLYSMAPVVTEVNARVNETMIYADSENIGNGRYRVYVMAKSAAGLNSTWKSGPVIFIDKTPPVITRMITPVFAAKEITISCTAADDESGISEYSYRIGTLENPSLFTGGWRSIFLTSSILDTTVGFDELAPGLDGVQDSSSLYVRLKVKNGVGLWSREELSTPIVIDKSPPSTPIVMIPWPYTKHAHMIEGVFVTSSDPESEITHCIYTVTKDSSPETLNEAIWNEVPVEPDVFNFDLADFVAEGFMFEHGDKVYISFLVKNGAGEWSLPGTSPQVLVDLHSPVVTFMRGYEEIIVNEIPENIEYDVVEDTGEQLEIELTLVYLEDGTSESFIRENVNPARHSFLFEQTGYGMYELSARARDPAGNESEIVVQKIRLNWPVEIVLHDYATTPGRELEFIPFVFDPDGDEPFTYHWIFGDGNEQTVIDQEKITHQYYHREQYDQISMYTVTLEVTDSGGKTSTAAAAVTVENTRRGQLYTDEYWIGEHTIMGDILVPGPYTLYVLSGTAVHAGNHQLEGYDHRLTIEGRLVTEDGVRFGIAENANSFWNGIVVRGEAIIENITIEKARRGLSVLSGSVISLSQAEFRQNIIGIHVLDAITISSCVFRDNTLYGIKEDGTISPVVRNCLFSGNTYDYYHRDLTVISAEELNSIENNSENVNE